MVARKKCFEIEIQNSANLIKHALTYSDYQK